MLGINWIQWTLKPSRHSFLMWQPGLVTWGRGLNPLMHQECWLKGLLQKNSATKMWNHQLSQLISIINCRVASGAGHAWQVVRLMQFGLLVIRLKSGKAMGRLIMRVESTSRRLVKNVITFRSMGLVMVKTWELMHDELLSLRDRFLQPHFSFGPKLGIVTLSGILQLHLVEQLITVELKDQLIMGCHSFGYRRLISMSHRSIPQARTMRWGLFLNFTYRVSWFRHSVLSWITSTQ